MKQKTNSTAYLGFSEIDITPGSPAEMVGFSRADNTSRGVLHPLKAQVFVCQTAKETLCLAAIDSLGFTVKLTLQLRQQMAEVLHIPVEKVMVCFSHTHSAPNAATEQDYFTLVCKKLCLALKNAVEHRKPFHAAWGIAQHQIGINRRGGAFGEDPRLGVLKFSEPNGKPILLLLRVSAHANVLTSDNYKISSDYFGITRQKLSEVFQCPVMMIQGASGNLRPKFQQENAEFMEIYGVDALKTPYTVLEKQQYFQQSIDALEKMADSVLQPVSAVYDKITPKSVYKMSMCSQKHRFAADVPSLKRAAEIAEEAKTEAGIDGTGWLLEVQRLRRQHVFTQTADIEFQYFILNEGCLCGVPNEIMCEISLDAWRQSENSLFFLNGYTNGIDSYLATAEEYDKGGYEVLWSNLVYYPYHGRVMALNRESAGQMADFAVSGHRHLFDSQ